MDKAMEKMPTIVTPIGDTGKIEMPNTRSVVGKTGPVGPVSPFGQNDMPVSVRRDSLWPHSAHR